MNRKRTVRRSKTPEANIVWIGEAFKNRDDAQAFVPVVAKTELGFKPGARRIDGAADKAIFPQEPCKTLVEAQAKARETAAAWADDRAIRTDRARGWER